MDKTEEWDMTHPPKETGDHMKKDYGKPRFDLIPADALMELAKLYELGSQKYDDNGWLKDGGMAYHRIFRALMSHATKFWQGEDYDQDDGQHHMTSVAWCAFALLTYHLRGMGTDDRFFKVEDPIRDEAKDVPPEDQQDIEQWLSERYGSYMEPQFREYLMQGNHEGQ